MERDHIPAMTMGDNLEQVHGSIPQRGAALPAEIARFDALAAQWWDPAGPMRALHAMNTLRVGWIARHLPRPGALLDVGCGAGLAAEALARRGHAVLGIDAAAQPLAAARAHAAPGLPVEYRLASTSDLVAEGRRFPAITALEVVEHVPDPAGFFQDLAGLLEPGGQLFVSTINRTAQSLVVAKWGAEYVLRLLPPGTHEWRRFVTPVELARHARAAGLRMTGSTGMRFNPLRQGWTASTDLSINYIAAFAR